VKKDRVKVNLKDIIK